MSFLVSALMLGALSVHTQPSPMTLGRDAFAWIDVVALSPDGTPAPKAQVTVTSSLGTVGPVQALGNGRFRARFLPPKEHFAQVALLLVEVTSGDQHTHQWASLPLLAKASLRIETKPRASVTVSLGDAHFGPVTADGRGQVTVPAVVPPGAASAMVRAIDRAGNATDLPLDLGAQPFPRARALLSRTVASWADPAPVELEVFQVDPDGQPAASPGALHVKADRGTLTGPVVRGPGRFVYSYRPADQVGSGKGVLQISVDGSPLSQRLELVEVPGPAVGLAVHLTPEQYVAGSHNPVRVQVVPADARGNGLPRPLEAVVTAELGQLERQGTERVLHLPETFGGRAGDRVLATGEGMRGEATLRLRAGPPARLVSLRGPSLLRAGEHLQLWLQLADAWGNPAEGGDVQVVSARGATGRVEALGKGRYGVQVEAPTTTAPGALGLEVRSQGVVVAQPPVTVLPYVRPWAPSVGLFASVQSNFHRASAVGLRAEVGVTVPRSNLELLAGAEGLGYARFHDPSGAAAGATVDGTLRGYALGLGARYSLPVGPVAALFAAGSVGAQHSSSDLSFSTSPLDVQSETRWAALLRLGVGATRQTGPGRLLLQLDYVQTQAGGQIHGNLGGLALTGGYVLGL